MYELARSLGYNGFVQIETIPFHSKDLNKNNIHSIINNSDILSKYVSLVKNALKGKNVAIISGANRNDIYNIPLWAKYQLDMIELNLNNSQPIELLRNKQQFLHMRIQVIMALKSYL